MKTLGLPQLEVPLDPVVDQAVGRLVGPPSWPVDGGLVGRRAHQAGDVGVEVGVGLAPPGPKVGGDGLQPLGEGLEAGPVERVQPPPDLARGVEEHQLAGEPADLVLGVGTGHSRASPCRASSRSSSVRASRRAAS
jgi:hypothetical protein